MSASWGYYRFSDLAYWHDRRTVVGFLDGHTAGMTAGQIAGLPLNSAGDFSSSNFFWPWLNK